MEIIRKKLEPNPVQNHLDVNIHAAEAISFTAHIIDQQGKTWMTAPLNCIKGENMHQFNIKDLPVGMYILNLVSKEQGFKNYKFIKTN